MGFQLHFIAATLTATLYRCSMLVSSSTFGKATQMPLSPTWKPTWTPRFLMLNDGAHCSTKMHANAWTCFFARPRLIAQCSHARHIRTLIRGTKSTYKSSNRSMVFSKHLRSLIDRTDWGIFCCGDYSTCGGAYVDCRDNLSPSIILDFDHRFKILALAVACALLVIAENVSPLSQ